METNFRNDNLFGVLQFVVDMSSGNKFVVPIFFLDNLLD